MPCRSSVHTYPENKWKPTNERRKIWNLSQIHRQIFIRPQWPDETPQHQVIQQPNYFQNHWHYLLSEVHTWPTRPNGKTVKINEYSGLQNQKILWKEKSIWVSSLQKQTYHPNHSQLKPSTHFITQSQLTQLFYRLSIKLAQWSRNHFKCQARRFRQKRKVTEPKSGLVCSSGQSNQGKPSVSQLWTAKTCRFVKWNRF